MVAVPFLIAGADVDMQLEVGISLSLVISFAFVPFAIGRRSGVGMKDLRTVIAKSPKAQSICGSSAILAFAALLTLTSEAWGLATSFLLGAATMFALALGRAAHDAGYS